MRNYNITIAHNITYIERRIWSDTDSHNTEMQTLSNIAQSID